MLILLCVFDFFFFKQKTAYEMRISDWSSDVCSSDLLADREGRHRNSAGHLDDRIEAVDAAQGRRLDGNAEHRNAGHRRDHRSEEHTSELQSLMRISYAVFCLKKKKKQTSIIETNTNKTPTNEHVEQINNNTI